jgi:hypothetical protein
MENLQPNVQKPGKNWIDETGIAIPYNRTSKSERVKEQVTGNILKHALKLSASLLSLKEDMASAITIVVESLMDEKKIPKQHKGNFTIYNFDRSIKIEVAVNEMIQFDDALIAAARECLDSFISKNVQGTDEVVRVLINSAFHNTKGGLDSKKVLSLMKYRTKIKDKNFQRAIELIEQSISRPSSKKYMRVWAKDSAGQYQNIDLNFSSI